MGILINASDFKGSYAIATDVYTSAELDVFINANEKRFLVELLGVELYALFIADLSGGVPQTAKYLTIYEPFQKEINNCLFFSEGMKVMLCKYIFFLYVRQQAQNNTISGNVQSESTISVMSAISNATLVLIYNEANETYIAIQEYIESVKAVDYPTYKGIIKHYTSAI